MNQHDPDKSAKVGRRGFLKGAAGAAAVSVTSAGKAQTPSAFEASIAAPPTSAQLQRDSGLLPPPTPDRAVVRPGSDLMVEVLRQLEVEYVASNPGSSFEGLQESIANHGEPPNVMPEFITALHEETSVDMANGYGKATGKPMCAMLHGTIGIQHASMAIYQAFYSGTPMLLIVGRDDGFIQAHTANDMAAMCRSFTKWDAQPTSLSGTLEAIQEAYRQAITPPTGPTLVVVDLEFQKEEARDMRIPPYVPPVIEGIDPGTAREIASALLNADNPRIAVGSLRTPQGVEAAVLLAELCGASVSTLAHNMPMSFPQRHPLCGPGADTSYDYVLGLEANSPHLALKRPSVASLTASRDQMNVGFGGMRLDGRTRGDQPQAQTSGRDLNIDAEASIVPIIEALSSQITAVQRERIEARRQRHASANQVAHREALHAAMAVKRRGWHQSPVSTARIYAELWPLIMNEDWCLASPSNFSGAHHRELWDHNKPYSYLGGQGAGGMGYGAGACGGAGLAARGRGQIVINIQTDGDLNYAPGVLWSMAHHRLPVLNVMHNNRAWHQELMFLQYMAGVRGRGTDRAHIGTTLRDPFIDYARMAQAYGVAGEGPIDDPEQVAPALRRGLEVVKAGEPYMIDILTQPR